MAALQQVMEERFKDWLVSHLRTDYPEETAGLDDNAMRERVRHGTARAEGYGIQDEKHIVTYVELTFEIGMDFEAMQIDKILLPQQALDADERLAGGAIVGISQNELHAVLITSQDRLLHVAKGADPQLIRETGETKIAPPGPFLTTSADIHLFFAPGDGRGIFHRTIYQLPLR